MSRGLKQAIYGAGFLLFFSAVIFGVYVLVFRTAPTCFDAKQNGDETGIDCGGACVLCAQKYAQDITVKNVVTFATNGKVAVVADMGNPNDDYGFRVVNCTMTAQDKSGISVGSAALREFIYDRKTKGNRFIVDVIDAQGAEVSDVRVACAGSDAASRDVFIEPDVVINRSLTEIAGLKKIMEPVYIFTREVNGASAADEIKKLEDFLYQKKFFEKIPDGIFGADTKTALIAYQKARGIVPAIGIFGPLTRAKVNAEMDQVAKLIVEPGGSVVISGSVKNNDLVMAARVVVTGLVYDASGILLGASKTELDGLQVKEERAFKLLFPETTPIDRVDTTKTRVFVDSIK